MGAAISVVTVVQNRVHEVETCLASIQLQTHPNVEHLVIDGGSTDGTVELLEAHRDWIDVFLSEPDEGPYEALNKGLALASGDFVGILHSDDRYPSQHTLAVVAEHLQATGTDSSYGDLVFLKEHAGCRQVVRRWVAGPYDRRKFRNGWMPPHPTFFVRRSLLDQFGGYREEFGTAADYEFMLRYLYKHRVSTTYLPRTLVEMKIGGISNRDLNARLSANSMDRKSWEVNGLKPSPWFRVLKPARKLLQYKYGNVRRRRGLD